MEYFKSTKGFACVYGEPGSGKTTSLRAFTAKLNPQLFRVIYLPLSTTTVQDFYRHLAVGLGLLPKFRKVDLFHQIQEQIVKSAIQKNLTTFIIIDEAQFVQHAIFHELRLLFNFQELCLHLVNRTTASFKSVVSPDSFTVKTTNRHPLRV